MSTDRLYELLEGSDSAMLVTETARNELRSRPMAIAEAERDADLWFATSERSGKLDEIARRSDVNISIQDGNTYVSISGTATVHNDREKIAEFWSKGWELWFPEGKSDPDIRLIKVTPAAAEYWDLSGLDRLSFIWKAGKAMLSDEKLDEESVGEHEKIRLGS